MTLSRKRIIQLFNKGCNPYRIAVWGENADNPDALRKLGSTKELAYVEQVIFEYQKKEGYFKIGGTNENKSKTKNTTVY